MDVKSGLTTTIATPLTEDVAGRSLSKEGAGTLVLSTGNGYSGPTNLFNGILQTSAPASLPGYNSAAKIIFKGGTLGVPVGGGWTTGQVDTLLSNATKSSGSLGIDTTAGNLSQWTPFTSVFGLTKLGSNTLTLESGEHLHRRHHRQGWHAGPCPQSRPAKQHPQYGSRRNRHLDRDGHPDLRRLQRQRKSRLRARRLQRREFPHAQSPLRQARDLQGKSSPTACTPMPLHMAGAGTQVLLRNQYLRRNDHRQRGNVDRRWQRRRHHQLLEHRARRRQPACWTARLAPTPTASRTPPT